jgi:hypothetical protein
LDILDGDEEERLHALGLVKIQETDWVQDVMRLRETKVRVMNKRAGRGAGVGVGVSASGGTRSRPGKTGKRGVGRRW